MSSDVQRTGNPWWEPPSDEFIVTRVAAAMRSLLRHRDPTSSICPSDAAKVVHFGSWRELLPAVRRAIHELVERDQVVVTRGAEVVHSFTGGPVRLRRGPNFPDGPS